MSKPDRRRITLSDVMLLVAATALGMALAQFGWPRSVSDPLGLWLRWPAIPSGYPSRNWVVPAAERLAPILPCLAAWTGAFLATRLSAPRPRRRRLVVQPGFVGAVAALSVLAIESSLLVGSSWIDGRFGRFGWPGALAEFAANATVLLAHHAGWAVAVSWLTLVLVGRWRPEPSWVDRWGRLLGFAWIAVGPLASLLIDHTPWWGDLIGP